MRAILPGAGLAALAAVLLASRLDLVAVRDGDEPKAPVVARTMVETGDWLQPRWNGRLRLEKPPLYPWLVAALLPADGSLDEGRARWPAAAAAAGGVAATVALGRRLAGPAAGWVAGLVLLTSPLWVLYARRALVDSTLAALAAAATLGFAWALPPGGRRWAGLFGFGAVGLGLLAKGPPALLPLAGVVALAAARRDPAVLRALPWGWGSLLAAAVALPWFAVIAQEHVTLLLQVARAQVLDRIVTGAGVHPRPPYWYLAALPLFLFPWSLFLPAAVRDLARGRRDGGRAAGGASAPPGVGLAAATAVSGLLVLMVVSGKTERYLLPLYPSLAVVGGDWWARRLTGAPDGASATGHGGPGRLGRAAEILVGAAALVLPPLAAVPVLLAGDPPRAAWPAAAAMVAGGALLVRGRGSTAAGRLTGAGLVAAATCAALVFVAGPLTDRYRSGRALAAALAPHVDGRPLLVAGRIGPPTALLFYDRRLPAIEPIPPEAVQAAVTGGRGLALVPAQEAGRLLRAADGSLAVLVRTVHRGRRLVLLGPPPGCTPDRRSSPCRALDDASPARRQPSAVPAGPPE